MRTKACVFGLAALLSAGLCGSVSAITVQDNFDSDHDYSGKNVTGTIWDGVMINDGTHATQDAVVTLANANVTNPGRLTIQSSNGNWEHATDDGFFLYKNVAGDFVAMVQVISADKVNYHDLGLMARVADVSAAGEGEDYVAARYYRNGEVMALRSTDNGSSPVRPEMGSLRPFLKLERNGNVFTFTAAADANFTVDVLTDSVTRPDLDGLPLQVGIFQATFSGNVGTAVLDNFSLTYVPEPSAAAFGVAGLTGVTLRRPRR